jgi:hypothetical protein
MLPPKGKRGMGFFDTFICGQFDVFMVRTALVVAASTVVTMGFLRALGWKKA